MNGEISEIDKNYKREWGWASVLIVDDQVINRIVLSEFCEILGIPNEQAEDGKAAVNFIVNNRKNCWNGINLILMDLNMPRMDGIQATKEIRVYQKDGVAFANIKIVAVTAFTSEREKEKWFEAGMDDFISKPVSFQDLIRITQS
jgi:CheY-like chemotaxis protein